jgi:hypothetical protein
MCTMKRKVSRVQMCHFSRDRAVELSGKVARLNREGMIGKRQANEAILRYMLRVNRLKCEITLKCRK